MDLTGDEIRMTIPLHIEIKSAAGVRTAYLSPQSDGLKDVYIDCRLNGESTLEFSLPATSPKLAELTPECQIWAGGRVYSLLKNEAADFERDENNKLWAKFNALERWHDLEASFVEPSISNDPIIPNPADLAVIIVGGGSDLSGGLYTVGSAAHALYAVLQGSDWTMGICDIPGTHDLEMEKASRLELIKEIQNIWGGYLVWDSVNKTVSLRDPNVWQNYESFQIRYAKNLKHITKTQSNRLITKMYCFGHDDLDIATVNGGVKYLTNFSYTSREYVGIYRNQDIYDQQELKEKSAAELALNCKPRYLYRVKIADLRTLPEYAHENFSLGDMVDVIDPAIAPDSPRPRLLRHKYNVFKPWDCELEIGDPEERFIEQLKASFDTSSFIDNKYNGNGQNSGYSIEDLTIDNAKIKDLSADKITAGTISATISIESPYIHGAEIEGGYIYGTEIEGGHITGAQIDGAEIYGADIEGGAIDIGDGNFTVDDDGTVRMDKRLTVNNDIFLGGAANVQITMGSRGSFLANNDSSLHLYSGGSLLINCEEDLTISSGSSVYAEDSWIFNNAVVTFDNASVFFNDAYVAGLDNSGYAIEEDIKAWVSANFAPL